jgi:hypothetical protein
MQTIKFLKYEKVNSPFANARFRDRAGTNRQKS